jgi:hypothetical protein
MLSAAVILVVFAVIALAGAGSAVWLYRAAAFPARRAQPAPGELPVESAVATGATARATADLAAGPAPGWPGAPAAPGSGRPAPQQTTRDDDEDFGVVWEAPAGMTADRPGPLAAPEQVYDLAKWPDLDGARDELDDSGPRGTRAWPDLARSLYSRGWPAMDTPPAAASGWSRSGPRPQPEPDGPSSGGSGSGGPGSGGPGLAGPGSGGPGSGGPGLAGPGSSGLAPDSLAPDSLAPDSLAPDSLAPDSLNPDSLNPDSPDPGGPESAGLDSPGPGPDGPGPDGPASDGSVPAGPVSAGSVPAGPVSAGSVSAGPASAGPDSDGTEGAQDEGDGPPPGLWRGSARV